MRGHIKTEDSSHGRTTCCGAPTLSAFCMSAALLLGEARNRSSRCFRLSSIETDGGLFICCLPAIEATAPRSSRDTWEVNQETYQQWVACHNLAFRHNWPGISFNSCLVLSEVCLGRGSSVDRSCGACHSSKVGDGLRLSRLPGPVSCTLGKSAHGMRGRGTGVPRMDMLYSISPHATTGSGLQTCKN